MRKLLLAFYADVMVEYQISLVLCERKEGNFIPHDDAITLQLYSYIVSQDFLEIWCHFFGNYFKN